MEKEGQDWVLWDLLDMLSVASGNHARGKQVQLCLCHMLPRVASSENSSDTCRGHTDMALCFHFLVHAKAWQVSSTFLLTFHDGGIDLQH